MTSAFPKFSSSQNPVDVADGEDQQQPQEHGQELHQIQTYYYEQDYETRSRRDPGWSNHQLNAYDGYYYPKENSAAYPQQQHYYTHRSTYPSSWNGGQGYGYGPGTVYSSSLYDTSSYYQRRAPRYGSALRAQFDNRDKVPRRGPTPLSPSPSYLSNSLSPSRRDEHPSRKLLVLDLNGTLLLRLSPPCSWPPSSRSPILGATEACPQYSMPRSPLPSRPAKRAVYARPYLPCFREYIFHTSTRCWLDVMIWSSAQPHSVKSMVPKCFPIPPKSPIGTNEGDSSNDNQSDDRFIAVWARDTLGLSKFDYSRKTQTTKDLNKPWSQLRSVSRLDDQAVGESPSDPLKAKEVTHHSAKTTVLLDDSPRKACLQPWNHVSLKEYDSAARHRDLMVLRETPQRMGHIVEDLPTTARPGTREPQSFDPTLLAIIGILEAVKYESNVAGWIRRNGLWIDEHPGTAKNSTSQSDAESDSTYQRASDTKRLRDDRCNDAVTFDSLAKPKSIKRSRLHKSSQHDTKHSTSESLDLTTFQSSSCAPMVNRLKTHDSSDEMDTKQGSERDADDDLQNISKIDETIALTVTPIPWFSHAPTLAYWVSRGRDALAGLGIEERHGVNGKEL